MIASRPELAGTFGAVSATHWLATAAGMAMLERGGNAFDAAVAAGFTLQVVEPHSCGPAGDVSIVLYSARTQRVEVICGQGPMPGAATADKFRALGLGQIPGSGLLPACVPGGFGGYLRLLAEHGTAGVSDVLDHAIGYAALASGQLDVKDAYSTDARIAQDGLVTLRDDLGFFPQYKAVYLYRTGLPAAAVRAGEATASRQGEAARPGRGSPAASGCTGTVPLQRL